MILGVDTDQPVSSTVAQAWQAARVAAVGRYLRNLQRCEVDTLHQAGLRVWAIFETNPTYGAYFTDAQGQQDAQLAVQQAQALGLPTGKPIFLTVDYVPDAHDHAAVVAYLQAALPVLQAAGYVLGVYGNYTVCWWVWNTPGLNNALRYWQTAGNGSCGYVFPYADLFQIPSTCGNSPTLGGQAVDFNWLNDGEVAW